MALGRAYRRGPSRSRPLVRLHRPLPYHAIPGEVDNSLDAPRVGIFGVFADRPPSQQSCAGATL